MMYATSQEERTWGMLCHLAALAEFVGVPFGSIIGPLVVWLIYRDRSLFADDQGRESLNFQLSWLIYGLVLGGATAIIGVLTCGLGWLLLIPVLIVFYIARIILVIMAAVSANAGTPYRYPFTMQLL